MAVRGFILVTASLILAGCTQNPTEQGPAENQPAAAEPEKVPHCFFKDSETKDWALKTQGDQAVVTGRVYRSDSRYKAMLLEPVIDGPVAVLRPSIVINDSAYGAKDDWWDVEASVPAAGLQKVEVRCGKKVVASLDLPNPAP
jgi:hypothetical protein